MKFIWMLLLLTNQVFAARILSCDYDNRTKNFEFSLNDFENKSFKKEFEVQSKNYKIFVKDITKPSEIEDYVTISDSKYKMTYPMSCKLRESTVMASTRQ